MLFLPAGKINYNKLIQGIHKFSITIAGGVLEFKMKLLQVGIWYCSQINQDLIAACITPNVSYFKIIFCALMS